MKKLHIILTLLLMQFGGMNAQTVLQLPVSRLTYDFSFYGLPFESPDRFTEGNYFSILAVPYEGVLPGFESSIIQIIQQTFHQQFGTLVEFLNITGLDMINPLASKGLLFFRFSPSSAFIIIELSDHQGATRAYMAQLPGGGLDPSMVRYGLEYSVSGSNTIFFITGPPIPSGCTFTLRKVIEGQYAYTWPIVSTFTSSLPFNPEQIPSGIISVNTSSLTEGSYVIYNDMYGTIAGNAVTFVPPVPLEYEWLNRPGETSTTRTHMLNKNGETYTMTAYVPLNSDISVLRTILNGYTYNGGIQLRLVTEVRRSSDIALTFDVLCEANTGSTQRVLNTGFSDRILPSIPNQFIQPGGGTYETTVEIKEDYVVVHHSRIGVDYFLIDAFADYPIEYREGNNGDIIFSYPHGFYCVAEYNGYAFTPISSKINMNVPELFTYFPHLVYDSPVIEFSPANLTQTVTFRKEIDFHINTLQQAIQMANTMQFGNDRIIYEYVGMNQNTCTIKMSVPVNCTSTDYTFIGPMLFEPNGSSLQIKVKAGCNIQAYVVTGSWNNTGHTSFNVALDGSQNGVAYSLVMERLFPTTPVLNDIVATIVGTGSPIAFENITQKGVYKVVVHGVSNTQVEMSGTANMYDNADMLVANSNWIKTKAYRNATGTLYDESAVHYDGLGRGIQVVNVGAGGNGNDIIQMVEYDNMGRNDTRSYMPYTRPSIGYKMSALANTEQTAYYNTKFAGDTDRSYAYGEKRYEYTGTTDKVIESTPGENTRMYGRPFHTLARAVRQNENVKKLVIATDNRSLRYVGNYVDNAITVKESWQEMGSSGTNVVSTAYYDTEGKLLAKRVNASANDIRTTYYVYDNLGKLRYTIPPTEELSGVGTYTPEQLKKNCFYTEYDKYGNNVAQYVPGAEPVYAVYDRRGRLVMSQSGNQRANGKNEWSYVKYDAFDRKVYCGSYVGGTLEAHRAAVAAATNIINEKRGGDIHGYTCVGYPTNIDPNKVMGINYYDDYTWVSGNQYLFNTSCKLSADPSLDVTGFATGSKSKVLGINTHQWLTTVTYYDKEYQVIQSITDLYPQGTEIVSNDHDFTGAVTQTKVKQVIGSQTYEYNKWFTYDSGGRLLHVDQQITGDTGNGTVRIASYTYDDLNQTQTKGIHNGIEQTVYKYRMNGQLISEVSPSFSYALGFDRPAETGLNSMYDGKLSSVAWGSGSTLNKAYNINSDGLGQILSANFLQKSGTIWSGVTKFAEKDITYDKNGNIQTIQRTAEQTIGDQNIKYYYEDISRGNLLSSVTINGGGKLTFGYDANGNLVDDMMSQVKIDYNTLDLPEKIYSKINSADSVRYIYSASGEKLATVAPDGSLTYYRSVFTYAKAAGSSVESLLWILQPEGLIAKEGTAWTYKYFKKDHVGSTRLLLAARGTGSATRLDTEQATDYYPFGLAHGSLNNLHLNRYLYVGKEYQDAMLGGSMLGLYDFHARYYNPMLGRWFNVDPALEMTNSYSYCLNNPLIYSDPNGEFIFTILNACKDYLRNTFVKSWSQGINAWTKGKNWHSTAMAWKIDMGLFKGNFVQILSRFTYEYTQTIWGNLTSQMHNFYDGVKSVSYYGGATAVESYSRDWGGFTLGSYINGNRGLKADPNNSLFQHEYGHYLQSQTFGWYYLPFFAIPSFIDATISSNHKRYSIELDANERAYKYFMKHVDGFDVKDDNGRYPNGRWHGSTNPIYHYKSSFDFNDINNRLPLRRGYARFKWRDCIWNPFQDTVMMNMSNLIK